MMDVPSKGRPICVLCHAPLHLFLPGLWLDWWRFYWWWASWFIPSRRAGQSIKALCQDRPDVCTVRSCLWLTVHSSWLPEERGRLPLTVITLRQAVKQCAVAELAVLLFPASLRAMDCFPSDDRNTGTVNRRGILKRSIALWSLFITSYKLGEHGISLR